MEKVRCSEERGDSQRAEKSHGDCVPGLHVYLRRIPGPQRFHLGTMGVPFLQ